MRKVALLVAALLAFLVAEQIARDRKVPKHPWPGGTLCQLCRHDEWHPAHRTA